MASILRQIVAGPRSRHPEANLDLCYVTSQIIATSGPSGTYPQRAYRNPLDQLVKFLDAKHGENWAIWEFRAEGTGYPDSEVYGRIRHYPWPDHHPPPFKLIPMIMASMRNWLNGTDDEKILDTRPDANKPKKSDKGKRVVVVHCKAGKGRSGTVSCSYLISECGWKASEALARFTERRMRPGFGQGVSIPSQLRWIGYVDRWTQHGKIYVEREIEICEVHVWGLKDGVKVSVEGFVQDGKFIKTFHTFNKRERHVVDGEFSDHSHVSGMVSDMASLATSTASPKVKKSKTDINDFIGTDKKEQRTNTTSSTPSGTSTPSKNAEDSGNAVIFKPEKPIITPTSDVNIDFERRNRATYGLTMVTSIAHVWFNAFFEGNGPEQNGKPDDSGVFEISWDLMDGIKGSSRKGIRAFDKIAVVWRAHTPSTTSSSTADKAKEEVIIHEPGVNSPVPEMQAADWHGAVDENPHKDKELGLRSQTPASADVSQASSIKSVSMAEKNEKKTTEQEEERGDDESLSGVKSAGPEGEMIDDAADKPDANRVEAEDTKANESVPALDLGENTATDENSAEKSHPHTDLLQR